MSTHGRIPPALADARARTWYPLGMSTLVLALGIAMFFYILSIQLTPCGGTVASAAQCSVGDDEVFTGEINVEAIEITGEINVGAIPGPGNISDLLVSGGAGASPEWVTAPFPVDAVKSVDETITLDNTLTSDADLTFSVVANATYAIDGVLLITSASAADFKFQWSLPAGAEDDGLWISNFSAIGLSVTPSANLYQEAASAFIHTSGNLQLIRLTSILRTAGTAGTAVIQWAQQTSNAGNTTLHGNSRITLRRIN